MIARHKASRYTRGVTVTLIVALLLVFTSCDTDGVAALSRREVKETKAAMEQFLGPGYTIKKTDIRKPIQLKENECETTYVFLFNQDLDEYMARKLMYSQISADRSLDEMLTIKSLIYGKLTFEKTGGKWRLKKNTLMDWLRSDDSIYGPRVSAIDPAAKDKSTIGEATEATSFDGETREKLADGQSWYEDDEVDLPVFSEELAMEDTPELAEQRAQALQIFGNYQATTSSSLQAGDDELPPGFEPYEDPPVPIGGINPVYPDFAKRAGVKGTVVLEAEVFKDGRVGNVEVRQSVQSGPGGVDEAAIAAVKAARFQPGTSDGQPVNTLVILRLEFRIN